MGAITRTCHLLSLINKFISELDLGLKITSKTVVYSVITEVMMVSVNVALPAVLFFIVSTEICICMKCHFVLWKEYN